MTLSTKMLRLIVSRVPGLQQRGIHASAKRLNASKECMTAVRRNEPEYVSNHPLDVAANNQFVDKLIAARQPMESLPNNWYLDPRVLNAEMQRVWHRSWLFAAYSFQIPKAGDFTSYQVGNDSIILIRGDDGKVNALFNTCRHRGSRLCLDQHGHVKKLVCPYHSWTYDKDGSLLHAQWMDPTFDKSKYGLHKCPVEEVGGLIFINYSGDSFFGFKEFADMVGDDLAANGIPTNAKIAHTDERVIHANWKLVYENNRECYHCISNHPEYIRANYDTSLTYNKGADGSVERGVNPGQPKRKAEIENHLETCLKLWEQHGIPTKNASTGSAFPGAGWYRATRLPLRKSWVSESIDGAPLSNKMLGKMDPAVKDMGSLRIHTFPNYWIHCSGDHAVSTQLTPINTSTTRVRMDWLVNKDAVEGVDYTKETLLPFWMQTAIQDYGLCEMNHSGVVNSRYQPGPFSFQKEFNVERFFNWYFKMMKTPVESSRA